MGVKHTTTVHVDHVMHETKELEELKSKLQLTKSSYDDEKEAVMEIASRLSFSDMNLIARIIGYRIKDLEDLTVSNYPSYD